MFLRRFDTLRRPPKYHAIFKGRDLYSLILNIIQPSAPKISKHWLNQEFQGHL